MPAIYNIKSDAFMLLWESVDIKAKTPDSQ